LQRNTLEKSIATKIKQPTSGKSNKKQKSHFSLYVFPELLPHIAQFTDNQTHNKLTIAAGETKK
jgi:hypothetical protein